MLPLKRFSSQLCRTQFRAEAKTLAAIPQPSSLSDINAANIKYRLIDDTPLPEYIYTMPTSQPTKKSDSLHCTPHMLHIHWDTTVGWHSPHIRPSVSSILNCGLEVNQPLLAFKNKESMYLFRPMDYITQFQNKCVANGYPYFDSQQLLDSIGELIRLESESLPSKFGNFSYVRLTMLNMKPVSINKSSSSVPSINKAKLFVSLTPVFGSIHTNGLKAVLQSNGKFKVVSNRRKRLTMDKVMNDIHLSGNWHALWLNNWINDHTNEPKQMDLFWRYTTPMGDYELVTLPTIQNDDTLNRHFIRDSVLTLAQKYNTFNVCERKYSESEVRWAVKSERLLECFATGVTASVIESIDEVDFGDGDTFRLPSAKPLYDSLCHQMGNVMYGKTVNMAHHWCYPISKYVHK